MVDIPIAVGSFFSALCLLGVAGGVSQLLQLDKEMQRNRKHNKLLQTTEAMGVGEALDKVRKEAEANPSRRASMEAFVTGRTARGATIVRNVLAPKQLSLSA